MKIATWNVNSLRARHDLVMDWLSRTEVDVLCMQETKVQDDAFPTEGFTRLGYELSFAGQKTYNGVAIASRLPQKDVRVGLHDAGPDEDKRLISADIAGVRVLSAYVPNGKSTDSPNFEEKLSWLKRLRLTLDELAQPANPLVLGGDFNIAIDDRDVPDPEAMRGQLHFHPKEHEVLAQVLNFGLQDAFRLQNEESGHYSWWDYRAGAFRRNKGLRIDYLFVTEPIVARHKATYMDKEERKKSKPSDHCPVVIELD